MGTLLGLADKLEKKLGALEQGNSVRAVKIASAVLRDLVTVTPVDTSEALSNWQIGIGSRPATNIPPYAAGRFGSTRALSAGEAISEGEQKLRAKKPGQTIYISNVTPYIGELDRGSSAQFAGGFTARARVVARRVAESLRAGKK